VLDAGKADHASICLIDGYEPSVKGTVVKWVATAFTAYVRTGKETPE
jgi:hypothetical protein